MAVNPKHAPMELKVAALAAAARLVVPTVKGQVDGAQLVKMTAALAAQILVEIEGEGFWDPPTTPHHLGS